MSNIYEDGEYLEKTKTWHVEDSQWKAEQVAKALQSLKNPVDSIVEIGCGAGRILDELSKKPEFGSVQFHGYDISPQAIQLAATIESRVQFHCSDLLAPDNKEQFDVLLAIDVFEHVPDYLGFLEKCQKKAKYKLYHVPLDLHVSSLLRDQLSRVRSNLGHLHYFSAKSAIETLKSTNHTIIDTFFTDGSTGLFRHHPSLKTAIANIPRGMIAMFSKSLAATLLGGYSLMVVTE